MSTIMGCSFLCDDFVARAGLAICWSWGNYHGRDWYVSTGHALPNIISHLKLSWNGYLESVSTVSKGNEKTVSSFCYCWRVIWCWPNNVSRCKSLYYIKYRSIEPLKWTNNQLGWDLHLYTIWLLWRIRNMLTLALSLWMLGHWLGLW